MAALLAVSLVGCGGDDDDTETPVAEFTGATPADGGELAANGSITLTFKGNPGTITASAGNVEGKTIKGPFTVGKLALTITWEHGAGGAEESKTLNYTVVEADETPPAVKSSDPENGAKGLDPAKVFEDGITVVFTETVTGDLMLMDGDDDVGWESSADGDTITLTGIAGTELGNETEYTITGTVADGAGNEAKVNLTFVTKAKE